MELDVQGMKFKCKKSDKWIFLLVGSGRQDLYFVAPDFCVLIIRIAKSKLTSYQV